MNLIRLIPRVLAILLPVCFIGTATADRKPNVIFILADDLGYGDMSCFGQTKFQTPHIDALAKRGMKLTNHYSGSTVCAPSRCALLTGYHMGHAAVRGNAEMKPEGQEPMPEGTYTVAEHLKKAGYKTGVFGKWGLGMTGTSSDPLNAGFDRFYGYNCQRIAHSYYPAWLWNDREREFLWGNVGSFYKDYAPDFIHKEALKFVQENKDEPFFLYYALVQPHADMIAPEKVMAKYRGKFGTETPYPDDYYLGQTEPRAAFVAMVDVLDTYVGELMAELKTQGVYDDTLVIFTSDNGAHTEGGHDPDYFDSNGINKGYKRDLYEGGIHVPMIAAWPGRIEERSASGHVSAFWDFLPTMAELTGVPLPSEVDGISYLPTLLGTTGQKEHDFLYWEFAAKRGRVAIRKGNWKGVRYDVERKPDSVLELYDLSRDPGEEHNLAAQYPEVVAELDALMKGARTAPVNPRFEFDVWKTQ